MEGDPPVIHPSPDSGYCPVLHLLDLATFLAVSIHISAVVFTSSTQQFAHDGHNLTIKTVLRFPNRISRCINTLLGSWYCI